MFFISGLHSFFAVLFLVFLHEFCMDFDDGNGYSSGCLDRYCLSISAVVGCSLYVPLSCFLTPVIEIMPCWASICFLGVFANSSPSVPISACIVKHNAMSGYASAITACTSSVFGIIGIGAL